MSFETELFRFVWSAKHFNLAYINSNEIVVIIVVTF